MDEQRTRVLAVCSVVAAALFWSSSYAVTKEVLADVGPLTIGAVRFTVAAVLLGAMVRLRRRSPAGRPQPAADPSQRSARHHGLLRAGEHRRRTVDRLRRLPDRGVLSADDHAP
ncbi:EamA family transporter [Streptomyces sennicomposti]|uniref:EamA family transporter n=1 Tax=Streptomyces sennicomposti TaxID=2873384 RepID=UPI003558CA92